MVGDSQQLSDDFCRYQVMQRFGGWLNLVPSCFRNFLNSEKVWCASLRVRVEVTCPVGSACRIFANNSRLEMVGRMGV